MIKKPVRVESPSAGVGMKPEMELKAVFVIEPEKKQDERGLYVRTRCQKEFLMRGVNRR